jgi:carbamoyl-phosphate synthase small subunit
LSIDFGGRKQRAILALANGAVFYGSAIGALKETVGEVVFNTAMTGYQEMLTDPSYAEQLITLTYPHVGNVGMTAFDKEADKTWAKGLIIRDSSLLASNWRAETTLTDYLLDAGIVAIADIDTRRLTRILRDEGAMPGCIMAGRVSEVEALEKARAHPGLAGKDLAKVVTRADVTPWQSGTYDLTTHTWREPENSQFHVVVYDFGVKQQILRLLVDRGCRLTVVPATTSAQAVLALSPDAVLLSNGPGDPAACDYAIAHIRELLQAELPMFGICLGFQLLALALGATTLKMKFGHHGANHPVKVLASGQVMITSQNHGFAVDAASLPDSVEATHESLFDGSLQGFAHQSLPVMGFQGHPEASPGPQDIEALFDQFVSLISIRQAANSTTAASK